jgi:hypothetical protein
MGHLSRDALLAVVDGSADHGAIVHASTCARCRMEIDALCGVVDAVRGVAAPEPSPLFWEHLSSRVREAVASEPVPAPRSAGFARRCPRLLRWRVVAWPAGACFAVAALLALMVRYPPAPAVVADRMADARAVSDANGAGEADVDAWEFLVAVADDAEWSAEESQDAIPAGGADRAIEEMSVDERTALAALLEHELRASGDS